MGLHIGTCGFSYEDWKGPVYPNGLPKKDFLPYYARAFASVELNSSFYTVPGIRTAEGLLRKTGPGFRFVVKAYRGLTHEVTGETSLQAEQFRGFIRLFEQAGRLGAVLFQFPYRFKPSPEALGHLEWLGEAFEEVPKVVEFRNRAWAQEAHQEFCRERELAWCSVDEPDFPNLMPRELILTSDRWGYLRFHGRNAAKWWKHEEAWERYDYLYSRAELEEWVPRIEEMAARTVESFVFFNNHARGQAVENARMLRHLLGLEEPVTEEQGRLRLD